MLFLSPRLLRVIGCFCLLAVCCAAAPKPQPWMEDASYKEIVVEGFHCFVSSEVLEENENYRGKRKPLAALDFEISTLIDELPPRCIDALRKLPITVRWHEGKNCDCCASKSFADSKHRMVQRTDAITINQMKSSTDLHQGPLLGSSILLHEFSHAVHHQVFGYDNPTIKAAYADAIAKGLYKDTYASRNHMEYFAEISCAYFGHLCYKPGTRQELKEYDPAGYRLMELTWGTPDAIKREQKPVREKNANARMTTANSLLHNPGRRGEAVEILQSLIDNYPETRAAKTAKKELERIDSGNHGK